MSTEAVTWVKNLDYDAAALGPFRVLLILAEHANSEGKRAFRSKRKIAKTLGVSERSVQRWYQDLIKAGLIRPGNQAYVQHVPANYRPIVFDLCMFRAEDFRAVELPGYAGETGLSTGNSGETTVVAAGETTVVGSRNQELEPTNSSNRRNPSTHARAETCTHGHAIVGVSSGGVAFCALGCAPADELVLS